MKTLSRRLAAVLCAAPLMLGALCGPAHAAGTAEVRYVDAPRFTDIGRDGATRERAQRQLTEHLQTLARRLPDGQTLRVEFTDIDLAGDIEWRRASEVRVLRGRADWPRMALRWTLLDGGRTVKTGEERIADMDYLHRLPAAASAGELPYDRALLDRWFSQSIAPAP